MSDYLLVIGNKNYSSWSLRAGLALAASGADYDELVIPLDTPETREAILRHSPAGRVPVLKRGDLAIWDSLAIAEYLAETFPAAGLWPGDGHARAVARAVTAEMHSGFAALRAEMPMDIRTSYPPATPAGELAADIARILELWTDCRRRFGAGGDFLFGGFTIADAFYAPVASRFRTYGVALDAVAQAYVDAVFAHPAMAAWVAAAEAEPWELENP